MKPATVVAMLVLLLGLQPVTTDLYLPALPTLQADLRAGIGAAHATLWALIISFGIAQLIVGPLSDRYGRRPLLLWGLALYVVSALGGALAAQIEALVAWRALQGAAMAAAVTCGRSIVRDLFEPEAGARTMSKAMTGLGVFAVSAPVIGGLLVAAFGWRATLVALGVVGAVALAYVAVRFEETIPLRDPEATRPMTVVRNWLVVVANPAFRAWALLGASTYAGLFCMLAGSSFVFIQIFGFGRAAFGVVLGSISVAYIIGTMLARRLLARHGLRGAVARAAGFSLAGGATMALLAIAGIESPWAILLPQYLYAIGHGVHQPVGQAGAVGPFPEKAGTAASLSGFAMTVSALGVGIYLGATLDRTVYPLVIGIAASSAAIALVAWTLVQRHGEPTSRVDAIAAAATQPA